MVKKIKKLNIHIKKIKLILKFKKRYELQRSYEKLQSN